MSCPFCTTPCNYPHCPYTKKDDKKDNSKTEKENESN